MLQWNSKVTAVVALVALVGLVGLQLDLALLAAKLILTCQQFRADLVERIEAYLWRGFAPGRLGRLGGSDSIVHLGGTGEIVFADRAIEIGRIVIGDGGGTGSPAAGDEIGVTVHDAIEIP